MADLTQSPRPIAAVWDRIDKVLLTGIVIVAVLAVFDRLAVVPSLAEMLDSFIGTLPFILFAVAAIGMMKATGSERLLDGVFQGREMRMIVFGALAGGLSPFCSCQVIPFIAALLVAGAPVSAVMAFWLSSPLMDPAMFSITAGGLGFDFALMKTVSAVALGVLGGVVVKMLGAASIMADPLRERPNSGGCCGAKKLTLNWTFWHEAPRRRIFGEVALENLVFLGKWLLFAYLLQALLIRYVPADLIAQVIGGSGIGPVVLGALVGAPAYLNGYAAVPLMAGLLEQGMAPGAAMSFVIAGGVSSIPAAVAVWALVKPRIFAVYLALGLGGAVIAGLAWGMIA
ncbi:MAG: permease [Rhodobacteraceae bacterium]|nr:permease [Paracoccaceae bacterium]